MGNTKVCNMVLLGAAADHLPIPEEKFLQAINYYFRDKSEKVRIKNTEAFQLGRQKAKEFVEFMY